ncbi:MAG TPA: hypothetical protein VIZ30_02780 [Pseudomonadales bacterium]
MSKRCVAIALTIASVTLGGCSGEPTATDAPEAAATTSDPSPEKLLAEPPKDWVQAFRTAGPGIRMVEYVPPQTDPNDWIDKVSFESFNEPPLPDAIEILKSIAADQRKTCEKFSDNETFSGLENDYPTSVRLFICYTNKLTKQGQLTLVKTIRGDTHFFVITRARRVPAIKPDGEMPMPPEAMAEWSMYLRSITVCNTNDPRHPCPSPAPAADAPPAGTGTTATSE